MGFWIAVLTSVVLAATTLRLWLRQRRERRIAARRRVEAPNSSYSSLGVRNQEDRQRWGDINMPTLHPINQEEVSRLLSVVDSDGITSLSRKDRMFLDNMTLPRMGV